MARTTIEVDAAPDAVWRVLADASAYGDWVVGTKGISRADAAWPQPGSALEYELGVGPISVGDRTVVVEAEEPRLLLLRAELKRLGAATIRIELEPLAGRTRVVMDEEPVAGMLETVHTRVSDAALNTRNEIALNRLKRLAETRA